MEADKVKILDEILGSRYRSGSELMFKCPKCEHHKKKLAVNLDKNVFKCWVCDYSGKNISSLIRRYGTSSQRQSWSVFDSRVDITNFESIIERSPLKETRPPLSLPEEFRSLTDRNLCPTGLLAKKYLAERSIFDEQIMSWRIGYCPAGEFSHRIIIPSFDINGDLNYYIARTFIDEWPKYKNPPASRDIIFNEIFLNWDEDVVLVEGVFDAIVAGNAVPLLGSSLSERSKLFLEIVRNRPKVYFALDDDVKQKQEAMVRKFLQYDITVNTIPTGTHEDVGSMTKMEFLDCKKKATFIDSDDYLLYQALKM